MTEAEWLACDDPRARLAFFRGHTDHRRLRLLVCAAWRWRYTRSGPWLLRQTLFRWMARLLDQVESAADGAREPLAGRWWGTFTPAMPSAWQAVRATADTFEDRLLGLIDCDADRKVLCGLFDEIFGNPFRPATLSFTTPDLPCLAQAAYDERILPAGELDPVRLAVLADALEEGGATEGIVSHLRSPGPHVRGCWAVDLCLGRS